jgi:hypothetical protein
MEWLGKPINVGREALRSDTPETQVVEQTTSNRNLPTAVSKGPVSSSANKFPIGSDGEPIVQGEDGAY